MMICANVSMRSAAHPMLLLLLICIAFIGFDGKVEGKSLDKRSPIARSMKKRVGDRFKDWKDEDEYVDHDYYKRKRNRDRDRERERERERQRDKERELDRERERMRERERDRERELQRERDHKELLEKLLRTTKDTPVAAIAPAGPLPHLLPVMAAPPHLPLLPPPPPPPPPSPQPTQAPPSPAQIQAPPTQGGNDMTMSGLSTPTLPQYDSLGAATGSGNAGGADWFSGSSGGGAGEIYSSTNLGGGVYDDFGGGGSSLLGGADWRELAHWYREQNWEFDNDWPSGGGHFGGHGGGKHRKKHGGRGNKGHKIAGAKGGLVKAKITALYVKKIGIAFLVALLAPLVVITVFGPFLTALSLVPLNFQLYGAPPAVLPPQQQQLAVPGQQLQRLQQTQQPQLQHLLVKDQQIATPSNGPGAVKIRKRRNVSNLLKFTHTQKTTGHFWPNEDHSEISWTWYPAPKTRERLLVDHE